MSRIKHGGLREAYEGYYEEDAFVRAEYDSYVREEIDGGQLAVPSFEWWLESWCYRKCLSDTPLRRLAIYCEWNGILGYSSTLYDIATRGDVV